MKKLSWSAPLHSFYEVNIRIWVCIQESWRISRVTWDLDKNKKLLNRARLIRAEARVAQLPAELSPEERSRRRHKIRIEEARRRLRIRPVLVVVILTNLLIASFAALVPLIAKGVVDMIVQDAPMDETIYRIIKNVAMFYSIPNVFEGFRNIFLMKYYRNRLLEMIDTSAVVRHLDPGCETRVSPSNQSTLIQGRDNFIGFIELLSRDILFAIAGFAVLVYLFWLAWPVGLVASTGIVIGFYITALMDLVVGHQCDERQTLEREYAGQIAIIMNEPKPERQESARGMRTHFGFLQYGYLSIRESTQIKQTAFEQGLRANVTHLFIVFTLITVAWCAKTHRIGLGDVVAVLYWVDKATDPIRVLLNLQAELMRIRKSINQYLSELTGFSTGIENGHSH